MKEEKNGWKITQIDVLTTTRHQQVLGKEADDLPVVHEIDLNVLLLKGKKEKLLRVEGFGGSGSEEDAWVGLLGELGRMVKEIEQAGVPRSEVLRGLQEINVKMNLELHELESLA